MNGQERLLKSGKWLKVREKSVKSGFSGNPKKAILNTVLMSYDMENYLLPSNLVVL